MEYPNQVSIIKELTFDKLDISHKEDFNCVKNITNLQPRDMMQFLFSDSTCYNFDKNIQAKLRAINDGNGPSGETITVKKGDTILSTPENIIDDYEFFQRMKSLVVKDKYFSKLIKQIELMQTTYKNNYKNIVKETTVQNDYKLNVMKSLPREFVVILTEGYIKGMLKIFTNKEFISQYISKPEQYGMLRQQILNMKIMNPKIVYGKLYNIFNNTLVAKKTVNDKISYYMQYYMKLPGEDSLVESTTYMLYHSFLYDFLSIFISLKLTRQNNITVVTKDSLLRDSKDIINNGDIEVLKPPPGMVPIDSVSSIQPTKGITSNVLKGKEIKRTIQTTNDFVLSDTERQKLQKEIDIKIDSLKNELKTLGDDSAEINNLNITINQLKSQIDNSISKSEKEELTKQLNQLKSEQKEVLKNNSEKNAILEDKIKTTSEQLNQQKEQSKQTEKELNDLINSLQTKLASAEEVNAQERDLLEEQLEDLKENASIRKEQELRERDELEANLKLIKEELKTTKELASNETFMDKYGLYISILLVVILIIIAGAFLFFKK